LVFKSNQGSVRVVELFLLGLKLHLVYFKNHLLSLDSLVEGSFELFQFFFHGGDLQSLFETVVLDGNNIFFLSFFLNLLFFR
jgi:hypothetical protein